MSHPIPTFHEAIQLLHKVGCTPNVIHHSKAVAHLATKIATIIVKNGTPVDLQLVKIGALLHDIGRSRTHTIQHAIEGAKIARSLTLPLPLVQIIERHIGSGITSDEAIKLGLPAKHYMPFSLEEKIVTYSDKLIERGQEVEFNDALKRFSRELGGFLGIPAVNRLIKLHQEISCLKARYCSSDGNFNKTTLL